MGSRIPHLKPKTHTCHIQIITAYECTSSRKKRTPSQVGISARAYGCIESIRDVLYNCPPPTQEAYVPYQYFLRTHPFSCIL